MYYRKTKIRLTKIHPYTIGSAKPAIQESLFDLLNIFLNIN